jgi:hypothetical protein
MENIDNPPVFPDPMRSAEQSILNQSPHELPTGLSLRDYIAIHTNVEEDLAESVYEVIMGGKAPIGKDSLFERVKWHAEAEAKYRYMKADAMLKARKETKTE